MYKEGKGVKQDNFTYENPRLEQPLPSFKSHAFWKNLSALKSSCLTSFQKACDLNLGVSCSQLGFMYEEGKGVKQDDFKALKFYQKACGLNFSGGCYNLGLMYEEGEGVCLTPSPFLYISPRLEQPPPEFKSHAFWKNLSALKSSRCV
jgi:TPR repeat protein